MKTKLRLSDHDHQTVLIGGKALDARVRCIFQTRNSTEASGFVMYNGEKVRVETENHHHGVWFKS
jgi:hypothetical protein